MTSSQALPVVVALGAVADPTWRNHARKEIPA
jgi:hypothetical protein